MNKLTIEERNELIKLERTGVFGITDFYKEGEDYICVTVSGRKVKYIGCRFEGKAGSFNKLKYVKAFWLDTGEEIK